MLIVSSIGRLIKTCTPRILNGQNKVIKSGCEKLVNPELVHASSLISCSKLNIPKSQIEDVLSLYQKYLKKTKTSSNIDFNFETIESHIKNFFQMEGQGCVHTGDPLYSKFIELHSLDILKSMIRSNIKEISPEVTTLLNDLKYYGLNSKTASVVQKFEENGINLITSNKLNELNSKLEKFLDFALKNKLELPKEINMFGTQIGNGFAAEYNSISKTISMNPIFLTAKRGLRFKKADGSTKNAADDYEAFVHEYFHFLHEKNIGVLEYRKLGSKTLFGYLCEKDFPNFSKTVENFALDVKNNWDAAKAVIPTEHGSFNELEASIDFIKKHVSEIFGDDAPKALVSMDKAFAKCQSVASTSYEYATKTPLETVAECGKDIAIGKNVSNEVKELLFELGCPKLAL